MATRGASVIAFTGRFRPESFRAFADHRARLLDLVSAWREEARDRMVVAVAGQSDFIDAFEMACSLGPLDCLVHEVGRQDVGGQDFGRQDFGRQDVGGQDVGGQDVGAHGAGPGEDFEREHVDD